MVDLLADISDDVTRYLNIDELATLSMASTSSFYRGLNNLKYDRFIPSDNGPRLLFLSEVNFILPLGSVSSIKKRLKEMKELLKEIKSSSNIDVADSDRYSVIFFVTNNNMDETTNALIKRGVNVNPKTPLYDDVDSPLLNAVKNKNLQMVNALIKAGADVNFSSEQERKPLIRAAQVKNSEISLALLRAGADISVVDKRGESFLSISNKRNDHNMIEVLKKEGFI